jgi:hypothetical protein
MFAPDRVLQRRDGPVVLWRGIDRWISGELADHSFADHTDLHRRTDIQLRDVPERSRRNQRDRDRQPGVERWDQHLLLDPRGGICERPAVQRTRRSCKSPLCREADPVSFTVRGRRHRVEVKTARLASVGFERCLYAPSLGYSGKNISSQLPRFEPRRSTCDR